MKIVPAPDKFNESLKGILNIENVTKGDTYYISIGRVQAIGTGFLLAETQQTFNITCQMYNY